MSAEPQDKINNENGRTINIDVVDGTVILVDSVTKKPQKCFALKNGNGKCNCAAASTVWFQAKQAFRLVEFSKVTQGGHRQKLPTRPLLPFKIAPPGSPNGESHGKVVPPNIDSGRIKGDPPDGYVDHRDLTVQATRGFYSFTVELLNPDGSLTGLTCDPDGQIEC